MIFKQQQIISKLIQHSKLSITGKYLITLKITNKSSIYAKDDKEG